MLWIAHANNGAHSRRYIVSADDRVEAVRMVRNRFMDQARVPDEDWESVSICVDPSDERYVRNF